jgi:two-component system NarL family sensor kinase
LRRLPQGLELAIFRVAQEALSNVYRHAAAKNAFVHLTAAADRIELVIEDDGKGMSNDALQSKAGVGISGMKERTRQFGGKLELMSSQQGTQLRVTFPLKRGSTKA